MRIYFFGLCFVLTLTSCGIGEQRAAVMWTDRPEFVAYAEHFNASQSRYKLEVFYKAAPALALGDTDNVPDIVVGSWLKSASTRAFFTPLDFFFEDLLLIENSFYPSLLKLGNLEGKQYLLPVSFNIPALIFSRENSPIVAKSFTLAPEDVKNLGRAYNEQKDAYFTRMGFSPRWSDEFLLILATLYGASFREGTPLAWDATALERAISQVRLWTTEANGDATAEDDFAFKYLYDPAPRLAAGGRILFAYMTSDRLFTVSEESRAALDFRWIARDSAIPVYEGASYLGMCKKGKARTAAGAFVQWFYKEETQSQLLDLSKRYRTMETVFGIADGFSAVKSVNEQIYPMFYPGLLGHVPPADYISAPNILPEDWTTLKR
ncbi:MAG: hypothetical protein WCT14_17915, partial [Treponemataceae bacterium]